MPRPSSVDVEHAALQLCREAARAIFSRGEAEGCVCVYIYIYICYRPLEILRFLARTEVFGKTGVTNALRH